jgi:hypothetical protein
MAGTVGTIVRDPGIVPLTVTAVSPAILRGQAVIWDAGNGYARPPVTADGATIHINGIAVSDSDTDLLQVWIALKTWTISVALVTGQTPAIGTPLYVDIAAGTGKFTTVATGNIGPVGWCVDGKVDALGNVEMAKYFDVV